MLLELLELLMDLMIFLLQLEALVLPRTTLQLVELVVELFLLLLIRC